METGVASSRTAFVSVSGVTYCRVSSGLIHQAEVWPREVRFAHPCRARARHPIHKAMGGHASHGHTSGRVLLKQRNLTDVSSENLVQFGFSVLLHLDIFLVICSVEPCSSTY